MNCKQGDVALIVRSPAFPEHVGKVVTCLRPYDGPFSAGRSPGWVTDFNYRGLSGQWFNQIEDKFLRPLRDSDDEDEMLRIVGKPTETPADVIKEVSTCS